MQGRMITDGSKIEGQSLFAGGYTSSKYPFPINFEVIITKDCQELVIKLSDLPFVAFPARMLPEEALDVISKYLGSHSIAMTMTKIKADRESELTVQEGQTGGTNGEVQNIEGDVREG